MYVCVYIYMYVYIYIYITYVNYTRAERVLKSLFYYFTHRKFFKATQLTSLIISGLMTLNRLYS